ncbi:MAG: DNRLRE domain-containing protein [Acidobacteriota bacterium]
MAALLLLVVCLGVPGAVSFAGPVELRSNRELTLQQGHDGYAGVRDTFISGLDWDTPQQHIVNYGQSEELALSRDGGDNPLLRLELGAIPANSTVTSARLWLYNTTGSSFSGQRSFPRRVDLFRVLHEWDEGNQVASPIDAVGKHGATGDNAFDYFAGEGTDVPWARRAMAAGLDYAVAAESSADVVNAGWYSWDVTALLRAWVRGEMANQRLVLRDATGYQDDHRDWRTFVSSQAASDPTLRPKLIVAFNPETPWADAGPDQASLSWSSGPVQLDGSRSHDRPGGNDASLRYLWRVAQAAYGSELAGGVIATSATAQFAPDAAGEWELELTVTNSVGESATDNMRVRVLRISADHPRIYLTPEKLVALRARATASNPRWLQLAAEADDAGGEMQAKALVSVLTGQTSYCDQALAAALALTTDPNDYSTRTGNIALVYDWCHAQLSEAQKSAFLAYFNAWADVQPKGNDTPGWGNYWPRWGFSYALAGMAAYGEAPRAQEWLDEFRHRRYRDIDLPLLDRIAAGGGWPEGMIYDWIANWPRVKAIEAWRTATGEDLFASTPWFRERLGYVLLHRWPGVAEQWGAAYHPYVSTGDTERNRGSIANYERIQALILVERFASDPLARQLQAYLATGLTAASMDFLAHEELLWFNPDQPEEAPALLTHHAAGTGTVFIRSGWPSGAADTDPAATFITFQCGDHFTYHQHYDQNSFTLRKGADLLIDSGVYSGDGRSNHDVNYYVRTIAHNTLVVYNPGEGFSSARPDAAANDGGQRPPYPATRSPQSLAYFQQHGAHYETGEILRFVDDPRFVWALGDATRAYNSPAYNQAMDSSLAGNVAKVSRFQRELVYLRPPARPGGEPGADYLVLLDRVAVTHASFSGANTKLLFHTLVEPTVNGVASAVSAGETLHLGADAAAITVGPAKLFMKVLLPAARNLRKVGGQGGKDFWVFGTLYDWHWDPAEPQPRPVNDFEEGPYGGWRLELEPADDELEHTFLTVLSPAAASTPAMRPVTLVQGEGIVGVHVSDPDQNRVVLFSAVSDGSPPAGNLSYELVPTARTLHLLLDLVPGARYDLSADHRASAQRLTLIAGSGGALQASDQGVLAFELRPGGHIVRRRLHPSAPSP